MKHKLRKWAIIKYLNMRERHKAHHASRMLAVYELNSSERILLHFILNRRTFMCHKL